jgi:hypothetical protein
MPDGPVAAILCLEAAERNDQARIRDVGSVGGNFVSISRTRISEASLGRIPKARAEKSRSVR